jgi:hypothetical protein
MTFKTLPTLLLTLMLACFGLARPTTAQDLFAAAPRGRRSTVRRAHAESRREAPARPRLPRHKSRSAEFLRPPSRATPTPAAMQPGGSSDLRPEQSNTSARRYLENRESLPADSIELLSFPQAPRELRFIGIHRRWTRLARKLYRDAEGADLEATVEGHSHHARARAAAEQTLSEIAFDRRHGTAFWDASPFVSSAAPRAWVFGRSTPYARWGRLTLNGRLNLDLEPAALSSPRKTRAKGALSETPRRRFMSYSARLKLSLGRGIYGVRSAGVRVDAMVFPVGTSRRGLPFNVTLRYHASRRDLKLSAGLILIRY